MGNQGKLTKTDHLPPKNQTSLALKLFRRRGDHIVWYDEQHRYRWRRCMLCILRHRGSGQCQIEEMRCLWSRSILQYASNVRGIIEDNTKKLVRKEQLNYVTKFCFGNLKVHMKEQAPSVVYRYRWMEQSLRWCHAAAHWSVQDVLMPIRYARIRCVRE